MASKKRPRVIYNPVDIMSKEEKREYTKGGIVLEYHIFKDIKEVPPIKEIRSMDKDKAEGLLSKAMSYHSQRQLAEHWGTSQGIFATLHKNYSLPRNKKGRKSLDSVEVDDSGKMNEWVKRQDLEKAIIDTSNKDREVQLLKAKLDNLLKELSENESKKDDSNYFQETMKNQGQYLSLIRKGKGSDLGNEVANMATILENDRSYRITLEIREVIDGKEDLSVE